MIDITEPLELSHTYDPKRIRVDPGNPELLLADVYDKRYGSFEGAFQFNARTGVALHWQGGNHENPLRLRPKAKTQPVDHFYIQAGGRDWAKEHWVRSAAFDFSTGKEAAEESKALNAKAQETNSPFRFRVDKHVEMAEIHDYPSWMVFRFSTGEYTPVPWAEEEWAITDHYAHLALTNDFLVAFVESPIQGQRDEMTVMAPGRYLKKYYSEILDDTQIMQWAVKVDVESELKFATTADEIYDVYTAPNSPSSCMRYKDHATCHDGIPWRSGESPIRIYGAGDLAIAYLERRGKITARALVWPKKKVAGRCYGDLERIRAALGAEGYEFDAPGDGMHDAAKGLLNGARLTLIQHDDGLITMPYMDYQYQAEIDSDGSLVMMQGGPIAAQTTCGVTNHHGGVPHFDEDDDDDGYDTNCGRCEVGLHYDDSYTVYRSGSDQHWCSTCYNNHTTTCDYCSDTEDSRTIVQIYDARDGSPHTDACTGCRDNNSDIQLDHQGRWIDVETANCCEECDTYFGGNAEDTECPNTACAQHSATTNNEVEA